MLLWAEDYPSLAAEATKAHGLTFEILKKYAYDPAFAWDHLDKHYFNCADAFIAHNGNQFDKLFYLAECERNRTMLAHDLPWIDTTCDLPYDASVTTRRLTYLAVEHGFMNSFAHRAVFDVVAMLQIFSHYDAERALWYCQQPMVCLQAMVSYDERQRAKDRGYRWDAQWKQWIKNLRLPDVEQEKKEAGFVVREVSL
jgi:DNA polymerase-3 subunit epsilon